MFRRLSLLLAAALVITSTSVTLAQREAPANTTVPTAGGAGSPAWAKSIRVSDEELLTLVAEGMKKSPTLRGLAEKLSSSDVVVYVRPDVAATGTGQGRLGFVSAAGGYRYLVIHVPTAQSKQQRIAMLGHLLQHTVAIAGIPAVVDGPSLKHEFERLGFVQQSSARGLSLESPAAVQVKRRILEEVGG